MRFRRALLLVAAGAGLVVTAPAGAQLPTLPGSSTTTSTRPTTTTQSTTTTAPTPAPVPTTAPPPTTAAAAPSTQPPAAEPGAPADPGTGSPAAGEPVGPAPVAQGTPESPAVAVLGGQVVATEGRAARRPSSAAATPRPEGSVVRVPSAGRSKANNTRRLLTALAPLEHLGMTQEEVFRAGFGRFPVAGYATFTHDWHFPRYTPTFHLHQGTDIFAATGTPVRSPADGTLRLAQGGAGGLAAYVYQDDGGYYYMAHLSAFVKGQKNGTRVKIGDVVGFVGDTGNAQGGSPHVHFEIHPAPVRSVVTGTGKNRTVTYVPRPVPIGTVLPAADPKATLDQWLEEALAQVSDLIAIFEGRPRVLVATGMTRRLAGGRSGTFPGPATPPLSQLLWATSSNPAGGALRLAEAEATAAALSFNWSEAARRQQELLQEQADAQAWAEAVLAPLTPHYQPPHASNDT